MCYVVKVLLFCADTPVKDAVQKKKGYNGYNGCSYCYHPGVRIGKNSIRYPIVENINNRTHAEALNDMEIAHLTGSYHNVFHTYNPLVAIPEFDIINGVTIDYMHCVLLGVTRQLLELWFDSENHTERFYKGRRLQIVDDKLLKIKVSRAPKSLKEKSDWKANELRNWLLFHSIPCLYISL